MCEPQPTEKRNIADMPPNWEWSGVRIPNINERRFRLSLIIALTTVFRSTVLHCDLKTPTRSPFLYMVTSGMHGCQVTSREPNAEQKLTKKTVRKIAIFAVNLTRSSVTCCWWFVDRELSRGTAAAAATRWDFGHDSHQSEREDEWSNEIRSFADLASLAPAIEHRSDIIIQQLFHYLFAPPSRKQRYALRRLSVRPLIRSLPATTSSIFHTEVKMFST